LGQSASHGDEPVDKDRDRLVFSTLAQFCGYWTPGRPDLRRNAMAAEAAE